MKIVTTTLPGEFSDVGIRVAESGDYGFICTTLSQLLKERRRWFTRNEVDAIAHHAPLRVACSPRAPSMLYGWAMGDRGIVLAIYVSPKYRGCAIARALKDDL